MLWADTESFSEIDLFKVGTHRYAEHESTEALLVPLALGDDDPVVVDVAGRPMAEAIERDAPEHWDYIINGKGLICFHNSFFDRWVWHFQGIELPIERMFDTMVQAYSLSYPGKLSTLGAALGQDESVQKMKRGKQLINRFCKPAPKGRKYDRYDRYTHPEEWDEFVDYAYQDVIAMRANAKTMPRWNMTPTERRIWIMDQHINDRGVQVDLDFARKAIHISQERQDEVTDEIQNITDYAVERHTKTADIADFCSTHGVVMPNMQKETIENKLMHGGLPDIVAQLLRLRLEANKASLSKFLAAGARTSSDSRLRGGIQYGGANRTMRWAGRGVQLHNLARPLPWVDQDVAAKALKEGWLDQIYPDPLDVIKSLVRGLFVPKKGFKFLVSDLSNIEGRGGAYIADEQWKLDAFRAFDVGEGPDIYIKTYSESFGTPIDQVTGEQRQVGKVLELAGEYQGWVGAWTTFSNTYGVPLWPEDDIVKVMGAWRDAHPATRKFWKTLENTWDQALEHPENGWKCGKHLSMRYYKKEDILLIKLPSGRFIPYLQPRSEGHGKDADRRYKGLDDKNRWMWIDTYGGKLFENVVQAFSRDILAHAMLTLEELLYRIVLHVHDEVVCEVPIGDSRFTLAEVDEILSTSPDWCPDMPLNAKGSEEFRYKKA